MISSHRASSFVGEKAFVLNTSLGKTAATSVCRSKSLLTCRKWRKFLIRHKIWMCFRASSTSRWTHESAFIANSVFQCEGRKEGSLSSRDANKSHSNVNRFHPSIANK
ncbi:hypothetical protein CEXT_739671 [Caerostris extrusa]|uniref:Uncharacterized protein n=1 Tax=Caerostris extrusa TaxID=172846 RepID=A0AAV4U8J8_CAEEX|nr:hypothetical protein CEXT_739671 [Caerostris extrusa]